MLKTTLGFMLVSTFLFAGCGNSNQDTQTQNTEEVELLSETDSLSIDLSTASDSIEQKAGELQSILESLNN